MERDSRPATVAHRDRVKELLSQACIEILTRANNHDRSKLESPERELYDEYTPRLAESTYGSPEYMKMLTELKPALEHHYKTNSHHPEHYQNGVNDMDLFDIIEMFFDWKAASERHNNGDIYKSIKVNQHRFNISAQLALIFENTADRFLNKQNITKSEDPDNPLFPYINHLPVCNIIADWSEAEAAMADTPEKFRDEGWHHAYEEMRQKQKICTCGLEDVLKKLK